MFFSNFARLTCAAAALITLVGCSSLHPSPYAPKYEALDSLKKKVPAKTSVAVFQPTDPDAPLNKISLRGSPLRSQSGSFAKYLEDAIIQDLKEMDAYDAASPLSISGTLMKNDIDISGFSMGSGVVEVALEIRRGADVRLKKTYTASTSFDSSFMGAVAIPKGQSEYSLLIQALLSKIYADPAFVAALQR